MSQNFTFDTTKQIRIDEFLRKELPLAIGQMEITGDSAVSNSKIRRLIVSGAVSVNGKTVNRPAFELRGHSFVKVNFDEEKFFYEKQPDDIHFEVRNSDVLFENDNLIFINKPAFFPVEQTVVGNRANLHDAVVDYLWKRNPELRNPPYVGIMHRLDRDTSGVILFTKSRTVNKVVSEMFQSHEFEKKYLALVPVENHKNYKTGDFFTVEKYMGRLTGKSQQGKWGTLSQTQGGQYSKTNFSILKEVYIEGKQCFLIECDLFTGRTHQIRVHLSELRLPILGDELYGGKTAKRLYLHASKLKCEKEDLKFEVESLIQWK